MRSPDARALTTRIAVVGASAAGLAAALAAARAGARVTLYESRAQVGVPAAPAIVGFDFLWPQELPRPRESVRRRLQGVRLRGASGRGPLVDAPLSLFDRARLDAHLAAEAEKAGARIETGAAADAWERAEADITIFADGARSEASRFLRPTRDPESLAWGAVLELEARADEERLLLTLGSHAPGGRSQLNPLGGGRWSHWTFFRGDPERAEATARRALALDARLQGWKDVEARFVGVAPDPVYTLPRQLVGPRVMVAGGAAGQGGLEVGLASGWMAGDVAARGGDLREYERRWKARYERGYRRLRRASDALGRLTDAEIARLMEAWDEVRLTPDARPRTLLAHPRGALALAHAAFLAQARA